MLESFIDIIQLHSYAYWIVGLLFNTENILFEFINE